MIKRDTVMARLSTQVQGRRARTDTFGHAWHGESPESDVVSAQERIAIGTPQAVHDQIIRVVDPLTNLAGGNAPIEIDCVPVRLVEVVARLNSKIAITEFNSTGRVALEANAERQAVDVREREHLAGHLKDKHSFTKGEGLCGPVFGQAVLAQLAEVHRAYVFRSADPTAQLLAEYAFGE
jgi:hypothetical protein